MKDFIAKLNQLKQKFSDGCGCRSLCLNAAPAVAPVRIPVTQLIFRRFGIFADRFGLLLRLAALFALPLLFEPDGLWLAAPAAECLTLLLAALLLGLPARSSRASRATGG